MKKYRMTLIDKDYKEVYTLTGTIEEIAAESKIGIDFIQKAAKFKVWYIDTLNSVVDMREVE